jgi:PAS domain S-box-containing protein
MHFQYTPYILPLLAAALISAWMAITILLRRSETNIALAGLALAIMLWTFGYALEIAGADLATKVIWGQFQYIGIAGVPFAWLVFAYNHSHPGKQMSLRTLLLLAVVPLITVGMVFTNQWHALIWRETHLSQAGAFTVLGVTHGPWFWIHSIYSYGLNLAGAIIIFRFLGSKSGLYRGQTITLIIAVLVPWLGNILYISGADPIQYLDLTPFAFTVTLIAVTWSIYGFRLIGITPLARDFVIEEMTDGMIVIDGQNRISDINPAALQLLGLSYKGSIGLEAQEVFKQWPFLQERIGKAVESLDEFTLGKDAAERLFEIFSSPLVNRRKNILGQVITFREITERKRADEQLRQLSRAVEASPVSIIITDTQASIQYINPKFSEVTGYTKEEVLGKNPRILKTDQTPPETHRKLWETITAGQEWRGDLCNRKKNGEIFWESASISPIFDAAGQIASYVAIKEDFTERKKVGEKFAIVRDQAVEANQLKSQLLANVSSGLLPPAHGILELAQQLQNPALGSLGMEQKNILAQVIERSEYLNSLVDDLFDEVQLEARTLRLRQDSISPAAILEQVGTRMSSLAHSKAISFATTLAKGTPERVQGDERRLKQILTNLVANAIQNTKTGNVSIRIFSSGGENWAIQITDTGSGIPANELKSIFEPFRQQKNTRKDENLCTGLGLAISKQLVDLMGGSITVDNEIEQGNTFTVLLPVAMKEKKAA